LAILHEEVEHLARLTHLGLSPQEIARMADEISGILTHIRRIQELDTDHIPPTAQVIPLHDIMRPDEPKPSLTPAQVLANAPEREGDFFVVPPIFGE
jgi:aspartyl-tRNA(Asn)/glutamyl-tRNA(Gln) amidotransferase subunit C